MTTQLPKNKESVTVSGGDYNHDDLTPPAENPEQQKRLIPLLQPQKAKATWIERTNNFLERRRKTMLCVSGIVILGTYVPAINAVYNVASEMIYIKQQLNSHSHPPFWHQLQLRELAQKTSPKSTSKNPS